MARHKLPVEIRVGLHKQFLPSPVEHRMEFHISKFPLSGSSRKLDGIGKYGICEEKLGIVVD